MVDEKKYEAKKAKKKVVNKYGENKIMLNKLQSSNFFFVDAETDGLYGPFISIAVIVVNSQYQELERHYWGICREQLKVETQWVKDNVLPVMGQYEPCQNEEELLSKFWSVWERNSENTYGIADVCFPVEARLFEKCIRSDINDRMQKGPYPLIDLSSVLLAKGIDPLVDRKSLQKGKGAKQHNALNDVEMTIEIWKEVMEH